MTLHRRGRLTTAVVCLGLLSLPALSACSSGASDSSTVAANGATGDKRLTIGIADDEPGVSMRVGNGYAGFDIETANYVAGKLGVPSANITWVPLNPADRIGALTSGQVDLVVATFSMTPEREQQVSFSGPYFIAHQDLLIRRNDTSITGPDTLDGKTLCSAAGTTSAAYIKAHYKGRITLRVVPTFSECVRDLAAGDVDAVTTDDLILAGFAAQPKYKGLLKVVGKGFTDERYGVGVKKGDTALVNQITPALKSYIDTGAWRKALDKYVAPSGYKIPSPPTPGSVD